ncbi:coiled-coil domain-containing protein 97 isoform X2 [Sinocyclocheilus rhinocerous]|uniref:coiled-coil domain-containing protein 97 isoform X2 n=1 Tax=Sinocyclocheilus rhinocerous TaxID=307959 RepID=UPI0007B8EFA6|nr:PREDICTED: coiled-coil domain-containing protein 97-like isoform X2 [Sinocyclocheilus rhinocerous]
MWGEIEPCIKPQEGENMSSCGTRQRWTDSAHVQKTAMWGEIQPCPKPNPSDNCNEPAAETDVKEAHNTTSSSPNQKEQPSSCLSSVIAAIAASGSPVKSQQLGEPDLTLQEKKEVLMDQYKSKSLVFLERYQAHLKPEHIEAFSHLSSDCRAQYYCREIQRRSTASTTDRKRVRNHRYAALRALQKEGQYFSEEQMRVRDLLLYEQCIGQYLSEEEILQRSEEAMRSGPGGLADLLINSYQEKLIQSRLEEEQEREQCAAEESEEEESDEPRQVEWEPNAEEKAMLREEFLGQMHQRFLDGKDDFNYSEVDENPDYDNLDIVSHDAEEHYFDKDDEEEEEEEEDMMQ